MNRRTTHSCLRIRTIIHESEEHRLVPLHSHLSQETLHAAIYPQFFSSRLISSSIYQDRFVQIIHADQWKVELEIGEEGRGGEVEAEANIDMEDC